MLGGGKMSDRPDFTGADLKLKWAERQLDTFNAAAKTFVEGDFRQEASLGELDFTKEWQELLWDGLQPVPPELGLILGDFVHNVRSALDYVMWELVPDGSRGSHTQFPISESEKKWNWDVENRR
jgi:hypothetical protein